MRRSRLLRGTLVSLLVAGAPVVLPAQRPDPLGQLVVEALRTNLGLEGERFAERRAAAASCMRWPSPRARATA